MVSLIIFPGYYVPHIGGLETHVDEFVKHLSKDQNYQITIFVPKIPSESQVFEKRWNNVKVIRYPAFELISNYPLPIFWNFSFWRLLFKLRKEKFNVVMTRTRFFSNSLLGYIFAKWRVNPLKLIHVEHGSSFVILSSKWKTSLAKLYDLTFGKLIFKKADQVIAISKAVQVFIKSNFLLNKDIPIIYRGIEFDDIDRVKSNEEIKVKFASKKKFLYVGRLYKWKGVENSILAIKSLPEELKRKLIFLVVGYGEDEKRLKLIAGEELNKSIIFLGKKSFEQSIAIMKSCDYYLHSSYPGGGLSSSLLQAMYCGCVPIASPYEGGDEVVNCNNGILLKDNHYDLIKEGIINTNVLTISKYFISESIKKDFSWKSNIINFNNLLKIMNL